VSRPKAGDWLIAHRGYPHAYPENSLAGVEAALSAGARLVEFDIQMTRDGVPVVIHDESLGRVGYGDEQIAALDWDALSTRSIGEPARFGERFAQQRLASLSQMLALVDRYREVTAFVEIKPECLDHFGRTTVLEPVCDLLRHAASRCIPISFDVAALAMARQLGAAAVGLVIEQWSDGARRAAGDLAPDYLFIQARHVPGGGRPSLAGDWQTAVYVVDDPDEALAFRQGGVDLVETDRFVPMAEALS